MKSIIIGLGNPGAKYKFTRHNVGFEVVDRFAQRLKITTWHKKHGALIAFGCLSNVRVILAKPLTFMNSSGEVGRELLETYRLDIEDVCVIYDDTNLDLGRLRIRKKGSAGGHKGMKSIIEHLNSENVTRIRIGVRPSPDEVDPMDYVLDKFPAEERKIIDQIEVYATEALETMLLEGVETAMNKYNSITAISRQPKSQKLIANSSHEKFLDFY